MVRQVVLSTITLIGIEMSCISPLWISRHKVFVPCGKCNFCLDRRRKDWAFRLRQEERVSLSAVFATLTYNPENLPVTEAGWPTLVKRDVQLVLKRMRKRQSKWAAFLRLRDEDLRPIRYYLVGEYGTESLRPHYHALVFNALPQVIAELPGIWGKGFCDIGRVTPASVNYVSGYVMQKGVQLGDGIPQFNLISNRSGGIGKAYLATHKEWHLDGRKFYVQDGPFKGAMPRYYKERIFSKAMRELHAEHLKQELYEKEIEQLCELVPFHPDPWAYHAERLAAANEQIGVRFTKFNQLKKL